MRDWASRLEQRSRQGLYRNRRLLDSPQGARVLLDGRPCLNFCSNDYLGLASHPEVAAALADAAARMGAGGGASHLICGHHRAHHELEEALARLTGYEAVLLFSTGYMANLGVISALAERGDLVLQDRLNHGSLLDGALLSRARLKRYAHGDVVAAGSALASHGETAAAGSQRFLVTDGVFSMDGDLAPLPELATLARRHDTLLVVDDAHGLGVLGEHGSGTASYLGLSPEDLPVLVGTLGKAMGTAGAFVAGSRLLVDYLIQFARSYIYTTAMPPAVAAATVTSLRIAATENWRRHHLADLVRYFREGAAGLGFRLMDSPTPIQPLLIGDSHAAVALSEALWQRGIAVSAIRPPTVPAGSARLRVTLTAAHTREDVERLLAALEAARRAVPDLAEPAP